MFAEYSTSNNELGKFLSLNHNINCSRTLYNFLITKIKDSVYGLKLTPVFYLKTFCFYPG